jgi:hypothetical protein
MTAKKKTTKDNKVFESRKQQIEKQLNSVLDSIPYDEAPFLAAQEAYKANETTGAKCKLAYISEKLLRTFLELIEINTMHTHRASSLIGIDRDTYDKYEKQAAACQDVLFVEFIALSKQAEARREARVIAESKIQAAFMSWPMGIRVLESVDKANWAKDQPQLNPLAEGMKLIRDLAELWNKPSVVITDSKQQSATTAPTKLLPPGDTNYAKLLEDD